MAGRDAGQALEAGVAEDVELAAHHGPRRQPRHLAEVRVHPRQKPRVGRRVDALEGSALVAVAAVRHRARLAVLADQPGELGAGIAGGLRQKALDQRLRGPVQGVIAEPRQGARHEAARPSPVGGSKVHRLACLDKGGDLHNGANALGMKCHDHLPMIPNTPS